MKFRLTMPKASTQEVYDVVVVGGGPAGLSAALYCVRFGLKTVVITEKIGGSLNEAGFIDDYIGIRNIPGPELARRFEEHVRGYGVPIVLSRVDDVVKEGRNFIIRTTNGMEFKGRSVIIAVGSRRKRLNVPGEKEYLGRGVTYCAPCDAPLFKGKVVAVVGGGNAALQAALLLTNYSPKVYLIHRRDRFRAFKSYVDLVMSNNLIEPVLNSVVTRIGGDERVKWIELRNVVSGELRRLSVEGVVIEVGSEPPKEFFEKIGLEVDEHGYLIVNEGQETSVKGVFAAGDCTAGKCKKKFDQVVTAAAEGAIAALSAYEYLLSLT